MNKTAIYNFLKDFEDRSRTHVLSKTKDTKERKELLEIALAKGIIVEGSRDIAVFKTVFTFADKANGNKDFLPEQELLKILPTLIGKSVNIDHIGRYVVGYYIDYKYIVKKKMVIAYGIFFKGVFDKEWEQAKELMKQGKLSTSHEIWHDLDKEEIRDDGIHVLHDLEISAGAILMKTKPGFKDTKVISLSADEKSFLNKIKENFDNIQKQPDRRAVVYACLTEDGKRGLCSCDNNKALTVSSLNAEMKIQEPKPVDVPIQPTVSKKGIICQNCGKNFEQIFSPNDVSMGVNEIQCPNCWCILDEVGKVIYPPQNRNFDLACEKCLARNNWLIKKDDSNTAEIQCKSCQAEYNISFKDTTVYSKLIKGVKWLKHVTYPCLQCGNKIEYAGASSVKKVNLKCDKCGLRFSVDFSEIKSKRKIDSINAKKVESIKEKKLEEEDEMNKTDVRKLLRKAVSKIKVSRKELASSKSSLEKGDVKIKKFVGGIKRLSGKIKTFKKSQKDYELKISSLQKENEETKTFYLNKADELNKRKVSLKGFEHGYTDEELMDEVKYELAVSKMKITILEKEELANVNKEVVLNTASQKVGDKVGEDESDDWYKEQQKGINDAAGIK